MAPDGIVSMHDTTYPQFPGVSRALGEVLAGGEWRLMGNVDSLTWICRVHES